MKDSTVGPTGLLNVGRSRKLLDAIAKRVALCAAEQKELQASHQQQLAKQEIELDEQKKVTTHQCRDQRRDMLNRWDEAEENLTAKYEKKALETRTQLNRLAVIYRRKKAEEEKAIHRKVAAREQAVLQQYENRKNLPGQVKEKEIAQINESLLPIGEHVEWARALTIRRLDGLMEVGPPESPEDDMSEPPPESVKDSIETIRLITRNCRTVVDEMQSGAASKIVDSFYLPAGVAVFVLLWGVTAVLTVQENRYIWAAAGIIPAGILGFTIFLILLWPLKRMTRRLYPKVERLRKAAEECASTGHKVSRAAAADAERELVERRDAHMEAAQRWKHEQLRELETRIEQEQKSKRDALQTSLAAADQTYEKSIVEVSQKMRENADTVAQSITEALSGAEDLLQQQRKRTAANQLAQLEHLADRLKSGIRCSIDRIEKTERYVHTRFPSWDQVLEDHSQQTDRLDFLPIGSLRVSDHFHEILQSAEQVNIPDQIPVVLHRRTHSCLVIQTDDASLDTAVDLAQQVLWRLLSGAAPARAKLTLLDPLGRGQNFTSFMALADHDPGLVSHRVWTTESNIEARLAEMAHHAEDVLQASLRDRFARIEDYNLLAGAMAEPYRGLAGVGLPSGLSREGYKHLQAIIASGLRCGVFTVLVCNDDQPWPADMPIPSGEKVLTLRVNSERGWQLVSDGLDHLTFDPMPAPPTAIRSNLVEEIGVAAVNASRVEIPLDQVLEGVTPGEGSTNDGVAIGIGSQGADRTLKLLLGEGVRQHVLIAGKTGSGKSTLLHSIITAGAYQYSPDQLHFYLLDFKKGVEFKSYTDAELPHARVVGIESEREFGRSVLQRLDVELQERGEKFRAARVQELGDFREQTDESMPRIMLVIDEFQELFVRDDRLAGDCAMLLDRLVRQGRSFGMHVILSSQSLAGAYSLPRATLGQMAVRIAMQCSETDAALILGDDNTAARLISRPGEAIYNDAGGLVEGNQPFQVAWLSATRHQEMLRSIAQRDQAHTDKMPPMVVFEGNRPCRWTPNLAGAALDSPDSNRLSGLLGEAVEIGPPVSLTLARDSGRNVLVVASGQSRASVIGSAVASFAKSSPQLKVSYFDAVRTEEDESMAQWLETAGANVDIVKPRDSESEIIRLAQLVQDRMEKTDPDAEPILVVIDPLERFRDLRQDESFDFSLDSAGKITGGKAFQNVLRDGPSTGVFVMLVCGGAETLSRWLPRASQHDLELRVLGQMNQNDSSFLIDAPTASDLSAATMLLYDHGNGRVVKFRQCALPTPQEIQDWLGG